MKKDMNFSRFRKYLPLAGIVATGLISALLIHLYLRNTRLDLERKYASDLDSSQVKVVVANRNLLPGTVVSADNMSIRVMPKAYVHNSALTPEAMDGIFGRKLTSPLDAGRPLLPSFLERPAPPPFSSRLEAGRRALTMPVDEINSISGLLRAGDHIDLLFTSRGAQNAKVEIFPLMQDVIVRATGQMMMEEVMARRSLSAMAEDEDRKTPFSTITIEVSQRDAARLVLAQSQGRITAILRGAEDRQRLDSTHLTLAELMGVPTPSTQGSFDQVVLLVGSQNGIQRNVLYTPHSGARP